MMSKFRYCCFGRRSSTKKRGHPTLQSQKSEMINVVGNNPQPPSLNLKNINKKDIGLTKEGILYDVYKTKIQPFDLIFFKGADLISDLICFVEKKMLKGEPVGLMDSSSQTSSPRSSNGRECSSQSGSPRYTNDFTIKNNTFSHVGMVVTSDILNLPGLVPGRLYIWESTMSGYMSVEGVPNISGTSFFGSQLRDLDALVSAYDYPDDTAIGIGHIKKEIFDIGSDINTTDIHGCDIRTRFTNIFNKYNMKEYDTNPIVIGGSICKCLRPLRDTVFKSAYTDDKLFCTELVVRVYKELGFLPEEVNPLNVVPMDFFGFDNEGNVKENLPVIIEKPRALVTLRHFLIAPPNTPKSLATVGDDWWSTKDSDIKSNPISEVIYNMAQHSRFNYQHYDNNVHSSHNTQQDAHHRLQVDLSSNDTDDNESCDKKVSGSIVNIPHEDDLLNTGYYFSKEHHEDDSYGSFCEDDESSG